MSRLKQNRIIDNAIEKIVFIAENQYSHSEDDLLILNEAVNNLRFLKQKKGKTNEQIQAEIAKTVALLIKFFLK